MTSVPQPPQITEVAQRMLRLVRQNTQKEALHQFVSNPWGAVEEPVELNAVEQLYLFNSARAELIYTRVFDQLEHHGPVLLDRFTDSTVAYQAYGAGFFLDEVLEVCDQATRGLKPDLTIYLEVSLELRQQRIGDRDGQDAIERLGDEFFERVRAGYEKVIAAEPDRFMRAESGDPAILDRVRSQLARKSRSLITVEGLDGAGKTFQADRIEEEVPDILRLREPGGTELGERVRLLLKGHPLPAYGS